MGETDIEVGRLALRAEGGWWVAYYVLDRHSMDHRAELGRLAAKHAVDDRRKAMFMVLMQECVADLIEEVTGKRPTWPTPPEPAPEAERSGNA